MRCSLVRSNQWLAARRPPRSRSVSPRAAAATRARRAARRAAARARPAPSRAAPSTAQARPSRARLHRVGRALQGLDGHDGQLPGGRLGRRHRPVHGRHRRLRRHRRGDEADEEEAAAKKKGDPVHIPTVLGAVTVSYNVTGSTRASSSTARRSPTSSSARSRSGTTRRSPRSAASSLPDKDITVCHRSDESGTTKNFTAVPRRLLARVEERSRRRQDGQVADRHGRQGQRRRGRLRQADRRRRGLRRAGLRAAERLHHRGREEQGGPVRRAVARRDLGGRRGRRGARRPQVLDHQRAGREDLPDHRGHLPARLAGPVQVGHQGGPPSSSRAGWTTPSATGRRSRPSCSTRRCPTRSSRRRRPRSTPCSATGRRSASTMEAGTSQSARRRNGR